MTVKRSSKGSKSAGGIRGSSFRVPVERLKRRCDASSLEKQVREAEGNGNLAPVGQTRAIRSLEFGLDIQGKGYNVFVMGPSGSGKTSVALRLIRERALDEEQPPDICYVFNFDDPDEPLPLLLNQGQGNRLKDEVDKAIVALSKSILQTLSDDTFRKRTARVNKRSEGKIEEIFEKVEVVANKHNLGLEREGAQFLVVPLLDGEPIEPEVFEELSNEEQDQLQTNILAFQRDAAPWLKAQKDLERETQERLEQVEKMAIQGQVNATIASLASTFSEERDEVKEYILEMKKYIMDNHRQLIVGEGGAMSDAEDLIPSEFFEVPLPYQVNVITTSTASRDKGGAPVIVETEPTLTHLFGHLEYREGLGGLSTDHTLIKAGAMHRANGGYLVLQADDVIRVPGLWSAIKRALRHKEIRIHDRSSDPEKPQIHGTIRPKAMPLNLKMILVGNPETYYTLMLEDEDFSRVFKVKCEFESWIPRDEDHEIEYCKFLRRLCFEEGILPVDYSAIALMIEESSRRVDSQKRLSTSLVSSIDLLNEADYWARQGETSSITDEHVRQALSFRRYRDESLENSFLQTIKSGEVMIDTDGDVIGQINGLLVFLALDHQFGIPSKITARTYVGEKGVINIDREAKLSGVIHDKGSMILIGLLGGLCAQEHPLTFCASITFEQNYGEIEGDSASCAEFYALLSSLAKTPIYQGIAVTGSINQQGFVQPIGGVNAKVEGMYKICKMRGLTGKQGVIIPSKNVDHLMLEDEVVEAVEKGEFHIWQIEHVFDGIEILMGLDAGEQDGEGGWTSDSLFAKVQQRLDHFHHLAIESKQPHKASS